MYRPQSGTPIWRKTYRSMRLESRRLVSRKRGCLWRIRARTAGQSAPGPLMFRSCSGKRKSAAAAKCSHRPCFPGGASWPPGEAPQVCYAPGPGLSPAEGRGATSGHWRIPSQFQRFCRNSVSKEERQMARLGEFARRRYAMGNPQHQKTADVVGKERTAILAFAQAAGHVVDSWGHPIRRSVRKVARFPQAGNVVSARSCVRGNRSPPDYPLFRRREGKRIPNLAKVCVKVGRKYNGGERPANLFRQVGPAQYKAPHPHGQDARRS